MDVLQIVATTAITALTSGIVGALVATWVSAIKDKKRGHDATSEAIKEGMKLMLVDKVTYLTQEAVNDGCITIEQRSFIHEIARCARSLGANGRTLACDNVIDSLPLKHT